MIAKKSTRNTNLKKTALDNFVYFQATELVGGDLVRQMKWPHVTPKSSGAPIIARLEKGRISTEKDKSFDSRMEFLYKNVVPHLFN